MEKVKSIFVKIFVKSIRCIAGEYGVKMSGKS